MVIFLVMLNYQRVIQKVKLCKLQAQVFQAGGTSTHHQVLYRDSPAWDPDYLGVQFHLKSVVHNLHIYIYIYTIWLFNIAMENGPLIEWFTY